MTARSLAEQALEHAEKATPGPWEEIDEGEGFIIVGVTPEGGIYGHPLQDGSGCFFEPDAEFIAFARSALPALAERVLALEEALRQANFFRDKLAERLGLVETAVVELESGLSCDSTYDPEHWRGHVQTALDLCHRATKTAAALATEEQA